jgi:MFS family permease
VGIYEINNQLSSLMGYWCNYIVNEYIPGTQTRQWQIPLAMQIIPSSLLIIAALLILPESPRFLVKKGKLAQARKVLSFVRHLEPDHEYVNLEMEEIVEAIQRQDAVIPIPGQKKSRLGLFRELWWKGNRTRVFIGLGLMFGQNLTGINGMNFYTPEIFRSIGFSGTKLVLLASGVLPPLFLPRYLLVFTDIVVNINRHVCPRQNHYNDSRTSILHRPSRTQETTHCFLDRHFACIVVYRWVCNCETH